MLLKNRVALVTGAGRGIGKGIALGFAREGATVAVNARTEEEIKEVEGEIKALGQKGLAITADIAKPGVPEKVVQQIITEFGSLDILVNNAAVGSAYSQKPLVEFDDDFWDYSLALNLTAPYRLCKAAAPLMRKRKWGRIINISSLAGKMPLLHGSAYAATKLGLIGFTRAIALELAPDGITVNAICPGPVRTKMGKIRIAADAARLGISIEDWEKRLTPPIGRFIFPEDFAPMSVLFASDGGAAITGQVINVCGGTLMY
jgi:meso-butanediol dehydrogenase/(S,S)-butanediol dehydrogenase/diacetyl reductase